MIEILEEPTVIKSTSYSQEEIIKNIIKLHLNNSPIECDPTYSKGVFYRNIKVPKYKFDINPQTEDTIKADSRSLPIENEIINSIMFDPPFVISYGPSLGNGNKTSNIISNRFSCFRSIPELLSYYKDSLKEFHRVLKQDGVLIFKCQDTVSSGKQYLNHCEIYNMAKEIGYYPKDLFILNAKNRIISGKHKNQQHCRKYHSYFFVFIKQ